MLGLPLDRKIKGIKYFIVKFLGSFLEVVALPLSLGPCDKHKAEPDRINEE
jgi:hypothetical protein